MSFYITLPCNASMDIHPDNRAGNYTTTLAREVVLEGEWEVGVSECVFPVPICTTEFTEPILYMVFNKNSEENIKKLKMEDLDDRTMFRIWLASTNIQTVFDIQDNGPDGFPVIGDRETPLFKIKASDNRVTISVAENHLLLWNGRNRNISSLLGFPADGIMIGNKPGYTDYVAPLPFGGREKLLFVFVYCNLAEYSYVGDSMTPCLRTLPISANNQKATILRFENPHYVPVATSRFSEVAIEFASDLGEEVKFSKGLSLIKLHLRPKKR